MKLDMNARTAELVGPNGLYIVLDKGEVIPGDPGAGCPALVCKRRDGQRRPYASASYGCATNEGVLHSTSYADDGDVVLGRVALAWLEAQRETIEAFLPGW